MSACLPKDGSGRKLVVVFRKSRYLTNLPEADLTRLLDPFRMTVPESLALAGSALAAIAVSPVKPAE